MKYKNSDEQLIRMLLARLERISADSYWAHRSSGIRGSLLKLLEQYEDGGVVNKGHAKPIITLGFRLLERAAREPKTSHKNT